MNAIPNRLIPIYPVMFPSAGSGPLTTQARRENEPTQTSSRTRPLPAALGKTGQQSNQPGCRSGQGKVRGSCWLSSHIEGKTYNERSRLTRLCGWRSSSRPRG